MHYCMLEPISRPRVLSEAEDLTTFSPRYTGFPVFGIAQRPCYFRFDHLGVVLPPGACTVHSYGNNGATLERASREP